MKVVDPVCGMQVYMKKTALRSEYRGQTYYFCTASCRQAFDVHPEKYIIQGFSHSGSGMMVDIKTDPPEYKGKKILLHERNTKDKIEE